MNDATATTEAIPPVETATTIPGVSDAEKIQATEAALKKESELRLDGTKLEYVPNFPAEKITAPDGFNIRTAKGQVIGGVLVQKDMRNIPGMVDSVIALDGVNEPLTVSRRSDGTDILLQGYRRFNAAKWIRENMAGTALASKLQFLPVNVYTGLTPVQERQMVNDQRSKSFSALEVFRWYAEQLDGGFDWMNVLRRSYHEVGQVTGAGAIIQKIDGIADAKERDKELRKWATSYVFQWWVNAWNAGKLLRSMTEHTYLWKEQCTALRPRVVLTSLRMRELWKAVKSDKDAKEYNREEGTGPRLEAKLKEYEAEDDKSFVNPRENDPDGKRLNKKTDGIKMRPASEVVTIMEKHTNGDGDDAEPTLVGRIIGITFKDGGDPEAVQLVGNFEKCLEHFNDYAGKITDAKLKAALNLVFSGGEGAGDQFLALLQDASKPPVEAPKPPVEVVAEAPKPPVEAQKGGKKGK